jgi:ParB-like chromosome segregation protein Spo0J
MKAEIVPIESLSFDPANVRKHPERNLATIKASLLRFGQQKPIVVDASGIVRAGNGTLAAAKALGWKEIAIVRSSLTGSDATAYAIADNRTAELAEWDNDALAQTLAALQIEDEEIAKSTGFDHAEVERLAGVFDISEADAPSLRDGDREPFRQMAFILHDDQHQVVEQALAKAKQDKSIDCSKNENGNGNAIAHICARFLHG